jgi:hypothetical protein
MNIEELKATVDSKAEEALNERRKLSEKACLIAERRTSDIYGENFFEDAAAAAEKVLGHPGTAAVGDAIASMSDGGALTIYARGGKNGAEGGWSENRAEVGRLGVGFTYLTPEDAVALAVDEMINNGRTAAQCATLSEAVESRAILEALETAAVESEQSGALHSVAVKGKYLKGDFCDVSVEAKSVWDGGAAIEVSFLNKVSNLDSVSKRVGALAFGVLLGKDVDGIEANPDGTFESVIRSLAAAQSESIDKWRIEASKNAAAEEAKAYSGIAKWAKDAEVSEDVVGLTMRTAKLLSGTNGTSKIEAGQCEISVDADITEPDTVTIQVSLKGQGWRTEEAEFTVNPKDGGDPMKAVAKAFGEIREKAEASAEREDKIANSENPFEKPDDGAE